jgi:CMP-N,N'-diacetyllegionaminic acid synthase
MDSEYFDRFLVVIPARGGSKGIPNKNLRLLGGKPLVSRAIEAAKKSFPKATICVSSDSLEILEVARSEGAEVPFVRPERLSTDTAGDYEVMTHALDFYHNEGRDFDVLVKWQPTTPFRQIDDIHAGVALYSPDIDMVVGVKESKANPYFTLFEESPEGFLEKSKSLKNITRRQDAPAAFQYNGSLYLINTSSLRRYKSYDEFSRIKKIVMGELFSIDIDSEIDLQFSEFLLERGFIHGQL